MFCGVARQVLDPARVAPRLQAASAAQEHDSSVKARAQLPGSRKRVASSSGFAELACQKRARGAGPKRAVQDVARGGRVQSEAALVVASVVSRSALGDGVHDGGHRHLRPRDGREAHDGEVSPTGS